MANRNPSDFLNPPRGRVIRGGSFSFRRVFSATGRDHSCMVVKFCRDIRSWCVFRACLVSIFRARAYNLLWNQVKRTHFARSGSKKKIYPPRDNSKQGKRSSTQSYNKAELVIRLNWVVRIQKTYKYCRVRSIPGRELATVPIEISSSHSNASSELLQPASRRSGHGIPECVRGVTRIGKTSKDSCRA